MGTGMSLTDMDNYSVQLMKDLPREQTAVLKHVHEMLHWFAGIHVRNVAVSTFFSDTYIRRYNNDPNLSKIS